ncbi:unnamed protein product, partial [Porites evermanni]
TNEGLNYPHLCRLLITLGSKALRATFDKIIPPQSLQRCLKHQAHSKLLLLRKRGVLNLLQWSKLYPSSSSEVTSASFDIPLLIVLLRTICNLNPPPAGWDTPPLTADTSRESDIVRVRCFMNAVSKHAGDGFINDAVFNAIDEIRDQEMDPLEEEHFRELLKQWKKVEDDIKDNLNELESEFKQSG